MIGVCTKCGAAFETTEEDANTPGVICPTCHWMPEAIRLLDTFGPWHSGSAQQSREWWANAGYPLAPAKPALWGLVNAVKLEQARRKLAEKPGWVSYFHFTPRPEST